MSDLAITQQAASLLLRTANETGKGLNAGMPFPTTITLCEDVVVFCQ